MLRKHKIKALACFLLLSLLLPTTALANSTPVYMEQYPSFNIAPLNGTPIVVDKEKLIFQIDERSSSQAVVTAKYTLTNTSLEHQTVPMLFPFISLGYRNVKSTILFNDQAVDYKVFAAGRVDVRDYLQAPVEFKQQTDIDKIIATLNEPLYKAVHFDDTANATLYKVTFRPPTERQCRIQFTLDPAQTRLLAYGFNGFELNQNGEGAVFTYISDKKIAETGYILVLGPDTLTDIECNYSDTLEKSQVITKDFIMSKIGETGYDIGNWDKDNLYSLLLKEIDRFFTHGQLVFTYDILMEYIFNYNNISTLLYEIDFAPNSTNTLQITFPMRATIDRRETVDYINTFAYLLNPARNFADFGAIDISIELNSQQPYIIDSSLPLTEAAPGIYTAVLNSLPTEDLIFSTYPKREITFIDQLRAKILPRGYGGVLLGIVALLLLGILALALIYRALTK
jgi:hypothetical protein